MLKKFSAASAVLLISFFTISLYTASWGPLARVEQSLFETVLEALTQKQVDLDTLSQPAPMIQLESERVPVDTWLLTSLKWLSSPTPGQPLWQSQEEAYAVSSELLSGSDADATSVTLEAPASLLIGEQKIDTSLDGRVLTPYSPESHPIHVPWWQPLAILALGSLWILLMYLAVRRRSLSLLLSFILALPIILTMINVILLTVKQWWLLLTPLYLAGLLAGAYSARILYMRKQMRELKDSMLVDRKELYRIRLDNQDLDTLYSHVKQHGVSRELMPQVYDLAIGYERKRSYERATKVYEMLNEQGGYEDSGVRMGRLAQVNSPSIGLADMQQTLVLDGDQLQLPELGRYQILRELGRGSMGVVYLAKDPKINRDLAIKTVRFDELNADEIDSVKQRFFREAQAAGRLNHPNIVTVFDVGEEKDLAYIAMDYVKGEPMSRYADEKQLLDYREVFAAFAKVAHALHFAHENDIVHRDIKPSNILYQPEDRTVKVSDFGIARMNDSRQTQTGIVLGSPSYMSPEQIRGENLTGQSDIFSLGVSLYQILTGHLPFAGENLPGLAYAITQLKHRNVRDYRQELPSSATRIINKALQKDPENRFQDAAQMAKALTKAALDQ